MPLNNTPISKTTRAADHPVLLTALWLIVGCTPTDGDARQSTTSISAAPQELARDIDAAESNLGQTATSAPIEITEVSQSVAPLAIVDNPQVDELGFPELDESRDFFAPPPTKAVKVEVAVTEQSDPQTVRLIGFVHSSDDDARSALALLKIGERLVPMREGESRDGIKLLAIDREVRSVSIEHRRERLTLLMMEQPIVNHAEPVSRPSPYRHRIRERHPSQDRPTVPIGADTPDSLFTPPETPLPNNQSTPADSPILLPDEIQLPELPELPGIEGLPAST